MQVTIYTDGACDIHAENQPGGWAAILQAADDDGRLIKETVISGGRENTTNNQMELTAVIKGLQMLKRPTSLTLVSDSRYVRDIAIGAKKNVKNKSLWEEFSRVAAPHDIAWKYVKGHSGDALNERCDKLAVSEKRKLARSRSDADAEDEPPPDTFTQIYLTTRISGKESTSSWAALTVAGTRVNEDGGRLINTSELEATLIGAIKSLESLPAGQDAALFTAQEYLSKGMNDWLTGWVAKGWKTRNGEPVKYRHHWERLRQLTHGRQVSFRFAKSRADNPHFQRGLELAAEILSRA